MRAVGIIATVVVSVIVLIAVVMTVRSIPDIQRYLKMRRM